MRRALSGGLARLLERDGYTVDTAENGQRTQQTSLTIVCTWCQQTIRWQRTEEATRGLISHSICFACFTDVLQELDPQNAPPPFSKKVHQR